MGNQTCKILYTNADSLLNKKHELILRIQNIEPDIIAIVEALPKNVISCPLEAEFSLKGYSLITNFDVSKNLKLRGLIIYVKSKFNYEVLANPTNFREALIVDIVLSLGNKLSIVLVYRSPSSSNENCNELNLLLNILGPSISDNWIILGDFNYKKIDWDNLEFGSSKLNSYEEQFVTTVMDNFLQQHVNQPTRVREGQRDSLLDLVLTRDENIISDIEYLEPLGKSDHSVLLVKINKQVDLGDVGPNTKLCLNAGDYDAMRRSLGTQVWFNNFSCKDLDQNWNYFKSVLQNESLLHIPTKNVRGAQKPPWMNAKAFGFYKTKKRLWMKYRFTKTEEAFSSYKKARNKANNEIKKARKRYENEKISTNPKQFWTYLKSHTKPRSTVQNLKRCDGQLTSSEEETANEFNRYFSSVFSSDSQHIVSEIAEIVEAESNIISEIEFSRDKVFDMLNKIKIDSSPGPDEIYPKILYEVRYEILEPLCYLFNLSLSTGKLPYEWKEATVVPIYKKGDRSLASNYRPVSLTSVVCKLLERLIRDELLKHIVNNRIICEEQFGFVPGRSCQLQLLNALEQWTRSWDEGIPTDVIYTDFSKAFDLVSHCKLIYKLNCMGVRGLLLKWIENFLSDRKQRVRVNNALSGWQPVTSGVPQGSVLGPILFVYYINDLPLVAGNCRAGLFADDAKFSTTVDTHGMAMGLQEDAYKICEWTEMWSLRLNVDKCNVLHIGNNNQNYRYCLGQGDQKQLLQEVPLVRDLGVLVDTNLAFGAHISDIVKKANRMLGMIKRCFKYMGKDIFVRLYKALVRPLLEYSSSVWSPYLIKDKKLIEGVQRRATKLIVSLSHLCYQERLRYLGLPTLEYRRLRGDMLQTYRIMTGIDRINPESLFSMSSVTRTRGHNLKIFKQRCSTKLRQNFFSQRVIEHWNALPVSVVEAPNINIFKNRLNEHWKNHPIKFSPSFME